MQRRSEGERPRRLSSVLSVLEPADARSGVRLIAGSGKSSRL